jgi:streptomycin 6-kinase
MDKAQKRLLSELWLFSLTAACALLAGCVDFGHTGAYKLALNNPAASTSSSVLKGQSQEELERIARQTLLGSGFKEATGRRTIWLKDGATVLLERMEGDALLLKLTSMGSAGRVRAATQIETELVQALRAHSEVTVTPTTPPKPTVN